MKLGVNVDHVATLRQARRDIVPDPLQAAKLAVRGGADSIVVHLREDRRHIQDKDVDKIRQEIKRLDLEMAATPEMLKIALENKPDMVTLVPEKREEITTEGGLDVKKNFDTLKNVVGKLEGNGIPVSLFINPDAEQIKAAAKVKASFVEIHTGEYANAFGSKEPTLLVSGLLERIKEAVKLAKGLGLKVNAGHGLTYENVSAIAKIKDIEELNIGHSIIARAILAGIEQAVKEMKEAMA